MSISIIRGDARDIPLADNSVDLIVTSPPYWALRSYSDDGEHYEGQIGSEDTPQQWLAEVVKCAAEWKRVLKPTGSMFVNLGDKYSSGNSGESALAALGKKWAGGGHTDARAKKASERVEGMPDKCLLGLPWRFALACVDQLDLVLREDVAWSKPNPLPESVKDRCRRSHEYLFHFVRQPQYYAATDAIRIPHSGNAHRGRLDGKPPPNGKVSRMVDAGQHGGEYGSTDPDAFHPLGKLPGSVWEIASQPLTIPPEIGVEHYAAFPMELPRRIILGWSPPGICLACGEGRRPAATSQQEPTGRVNSGRAKRQTVNGTALSRGFNAAGYPHTVRLTTIPGWVCACTPYTDYPERRRPSVTTSRMLRNDQDERERQGLPRRHGDDWPERLPVREYHLEEWEPAPTRPAVVLDPFGGTGTTALVASVLGRHAVTVDRSSDYCRATAWRTTDRGEIARAMQVPKPVKQPDAQYELFDLAELGG